MKIVLIRHGQSQWNLENRFTGWVDVDLSKKGIEESKKAAKLLKKNHYTFDLVYTSVLKRAIRTAWIIMDEMDLMWVPIKKHWRLNERFYGGLTGLNKQEMREKAGEEQVHIWRRSYDVRPPEISKESEYYMRNDPKYSGLKDEEIPLTECLKDNVERTIPYWKEEIEPQIKKGKKILIAAHGNSLRGIVKYLDNISDEEIPKKEIPTGIPLVYELDENLKPIKNYYLE